MSSSPNSSSSSDAIAAELLPLQSVTCRVDIVLGSGTMRVRECLNLRKHTVLPLLQAAGSDLRVLVNGVAIAHGEVVIVDNSTAIRITEIVQPTGAEAPL
jgi:flagellar motor switch protein FliN/FliY